MFSALGLFRDVNCPQADCNLPNCLFGHNLIEANRREAKVYDPTCLDPEELPPAKRQRVETSGQSKPPRSNLAGNTLAVHVPGKLAQVDLNSSEKPAHLDSTVRPTSNTTSTTAKYPASTMTRPISPPPLKAKSVARPKVNEAKQHKPETLVPRTAHKDPVPFPQRMKILQRLHEQVAGLNMKLQKSGETNSELNLSEQDLIKISLHEEHKAAQAYSSADGYKNALAQRLAFFRRMDTEKWSAFITTEWRTPMNKEQPETDDDSVSSLSHEQEKAMLPFLQTSLIGLEAYGYVLSPPTAKEIENTRKAYHSAAGWEICDRCGSRFQVFPGRNEDGVLTTRGRCTYHWAKAQRRRDVNESVYSCCGQSAGSEGCVTCETHVFKTTDPKRLASLLQFERTPANNHKSLPMAVTFDCEMAYTTHGMELIRLTAISWPEKKDLLDVLVRPYGEVLDFNTRFSGVDPQQYAEALPYDETADGVIDRFEANNQEEKLLHKVDSVETARRLLFSIISPETPVIGHAIDNDLNTCRIIHPAVVDTVLLFPHPRGLPFRYKLRDLSVKYLRRQIQTAGTSGHDSKEDSKATGDLARVKAEEKFKSLLQSGYKWKDGQLISAARM